LKPTVFERLLSKLFEHFDIVKPISKPCSVCNGTGKVGGIGIFVCSDCFHGTTTKDVLYLRRYYLFRSKRFNLYLHHFFRSDDDPDPHDHPWDFTSIVLWGGYTEERYRFFATETEPSFETEEGTAQRHPCVYEIDGRRTGPEYKAVRPLTIQFRKAETIHRVLLTNGRAWTLVITGPERRPWHFIKAKSREFWRSYLGVWGDDHA
jgi:hypothetical protein